MAATRIARELNLPRAKNSVVAAVNMRIRKRKPAILALKRRDPSGVRIVMSAALILIPPLESW